VLKARAPVAAPAQLAASGAVNDIHTSPYTKEAPLTATLSVNQKITGRDSEKDVRHIEIDLGDSGLRYQPGDALGVWYQNDPQLVKELVELLWLKGDEPVTVDGKTLPLAEALQWHFELTVNTAIVENYATLTRSESLLPLVGDKAQLQQYAAATPIVDMVRFSPAQLDAEALIGLLRPLTPRLYSIASRRRKWRAKCMSPWAWCAMTSKAAPGLAAPPASSPTAWKKMAKSASLSSTTTTSVCRLTRRRR
jgi:sulfite reductase (NADPH) flavoprotein alpha-component